MDTALPFSIVSFGIVAIGVVVYQRYARQQRRNGFSAFAARHAMTYHQHDPFDLLAEPFRLFTRGDGRGIENVVDGTWQDVPIRAFDYWYHEESRDSNGRSSRTTYRFDCAVAPIEAVCPPLMIARENVFTRLADRFALDDITFELEEFNRAFTVEGSDRRFATAICDQRMMRWLLANAGDHAFEVVGDRVLVSSRQVEVEALPVLFATMRGFREQVPEVVYSLYPR